MSHSSHRLLRANPVHFPAFLETELGADCADPRVVSWFDSMAEQSPLTSCEPDNLIEISSEQQEVDHKKVRPIQMGELLREHVLRRLLALNEERNCSLDDFDAADWNGFSRRRRGPGHFSSAPLQ